MIKKAVKNKIRKDRHKRIRNKVQGTPERPRLNVFRSNKQIYAQLIDDQNGVTLASASSIDKEIKSQCEGITKSEAAKIVGAQVAKNAKEAGITKCVFDRAGYVYQGRVQSLADGAREAGLEF